jgi:single-strand DNA-binding protein
MNGINKAIIVGRVGQDPKITDFSNGGKCAQFTVATTERGFKTRDGRDVPERTEWHVCVCYSSLAQVIQNFVRKGSSVYLEGKMRTRKFTDQNNIERSVTEIHVDELQLLDRKQDADTSSSQQTASSSTAQEASQQAQNDGNQSEDLPF